MRPLLAILSLAFASAALAIPLHKGETWTWKIEVAGQSTFRTATVTDSTRLDSTRTSWTLAVKDSSSDQVGTVRILSESGIQTWEERSALLPWALDDLDLSSWGCQSPFNRCEYVALTGEELSAPKLLGTPPDEYHAPRALTSFTRPGIEGATWIPRHKGVWDSVHGLTRFQTDRETWTLLLHNHEPVALPAPALVLPKSGTSWTWAEETSGSTVWEESDGNAIRKVSVLGRPEDSANVARIQLKEDVNGVVTNFQCRIPRSAPELRTNCPSYSSEWIVDWRELPSDPSGLRVRDSSTWSTGFTWGVNVQSGTIRHTRIGEDGIALLRRTATFKQTIVNTGAPMYLNGSSPITTQEISSTRLVELNGIAIEVASRIRRPARSSSALKALLQRWPNQTLTWHDLAGRSGTLRASELLSPTASPRILLLDATFPDGTRWQGKHLLGSRRATR